MTSELVCHEMVRLGFDGAAAVITVGNGRRRNALTMAGWEQLEEIVRGIASDAYVRAALIRGAGDTFCAGSDMNEWLGASPSAVEASFAAMERAFRAIEQSPLPFVAEIRGVAAGAGCQLALACDLRVMADSAHIGMPIARLGILPTPAFAARLVNVAGSAVARELLYTGRLLNAHEAVSVGLANTAVPGSVLDDHSEQLLISIARQPRAAIHAAKRAVTIATGEPSRVSLGPAVSYDEFQRSVDAFLH
jgi:enoyl-CoA hydratase/carnithine racemase